MLTLYTKEEQIRIKKSIKQLLEMLMQTEDEDIWMILESARDEEVKFFLGQYETAFHYLFNDEDEALQEAGAVALCLNDLPQTFEWIAEHWGKNWFSFFVTRRNPKEVIAHLSTLCYLQAEEKRYLFRYYDPVTFTSWIKGLKEIKRVDEALGVFSEVYVESPLPHILTEYTMEHHGYSQHDIDLKENLQGFVRPLPKETAASPLDTGVWQMGQAEYASLAPVSLNAFKIKLCKELAKRYDLLASHTLTEVYVIINTQTARALKHGITQKHLIAQYVTMVFAYPAFWERYQENIEKVLSAETLNPTDKIETILVAAEKEKENAHAIL